MLTHSINIYKPPASISQANTPVYHQQQRPQTVPRLSKFDYNLLISNLPFKRGDVLISKVLMNQENVTKFAIYKLVDIQEIHYMAEYTNSNLPRCLMLKDQNGFTFWSSPEYWNHCPQEVLEKLQLTEWAKE